MPEAADKPANHGRRLTSLLKLLVCVCLVAVSFLHPYSALRLTIVETLGAPLRIVLGFFPGLFFRDKPYYNVYGSLAVTITYACLIYVAWSLIEHFVRRRRAASSKDAPDQEPSK